MNVRKIKWTTNKFESYWYCSIFIFVFEPWLHWKRWIRWIKSVLYHLIHLLQCNPGSKTKWTIIKWELIFRDFLTYVRNARKINSSFKTVHFRFWTMITLKKMNKMNLKCFFHLIHLLQCNPGSKTKWTIIKWGTYFQRFPYLLSKHLKAYV